MENIISFKKTNTNVFYFILKTNLGDVYSETKKNVFFREILADNENIK